jgi:hypothetical protein
MEIGPIALSLVLGTSPTHTFSDLRLYKNHFLDLGFPLNRHFLYMLKLENCDKNNWLPELLCIVLYGEEVEMQLDSK